jgi:hypothetical protein
VCFSLYQTFKVTWKLIVLVLVSFTLDSLTFFDTNAKPILMHQMRILTNFKSLCSGTWTEKVENTKTETVKTVRKKRAEKTNTVP